MLSGENRLSDAPLADRFPAAARAALVPNPPLVCPNPLVLPAAAGASAPKPLLNPPPVFAVDEKLNPEAEPNPDVTAGLSEIGAVKEKVEAKGAEVTAEEEPNPEGSCVGAATALPKPPPAVAKLKLLACTGAGAPKPAWSERFYSVDMDWIT